jgi:putative membrane protein
MRYLSLISGIALFLLALGFALKNSESVTLHYFLGYQWEAPLVVVLVTAFCLGTASGIAATLGHIFKQRREIQKLRREAKVSMQASAPISLDTNVQPNP